MCLGTLLLVQVDDQYGFSDSQRLIYMSVKCLQKKPSKTLNLKNGQILEK